MSEPLAGDQNLGHLEVQAAHDVQNLLREAVERGARAKADASPPRCPVCQQKLARLSGGQARTFECRFGAITVKRTRGFCKRCHKWRVPADTALGLEESAGYSPAVQDMAALLASKMPVEDASAVLEHLTGVKLPREWGQSNIMTYLLTMHLISRPSRGVGTKCKYVIVWDPFPDERRPLTSASQAQRAIIP